MKKRRKTKSSLWWKEWK